MPEIISQAAQNAEPRLPIPTDEEVVERVLSGELAVFEVLMRRYNQRLFRVVRSIVDHDDEAEDVLQQTYTSAFEHLRQFAGRAKFSTWLTRIAVHEALARLKQRQRLRPVDFSAADNAGLVPLSRAPSAERVAVNQELTVLLAKVVGELPVELRIVFALRIVEGASTSESAACLNLSEANVKVRLHRARALLQARIDGQIGEEARRLYQFGGARCDRIVHTVLRRLRLEKSQ
jgi:RNA polymerase sigma-70 factor (ECF subfamily)